MWVLIASHDDGDSWAAGFGVDLLGGVLAGLIGTAIIYGFSKVRQQRRNSADFGCLAGVYDVTVKQSDEPEGSVMITGDGPLLSFAWKMDGGTDAVGTIAMNEQSRVTGSGSYEHGDGWGYLTVQVASRERGAARLLVDGRYTRQKERDEVSTAWVWEMSEPAG